MGEIRLEGYFAADSAAFFGTGEGWQTARLSVPLQVVPGNTYIVSYRSSQLTSYASMEPNFETNSPLSNGPITYVTSGPGTPSNAVLLTPNGTQNLPGVNVGADVEFVLDDVCGFHFAGDERAAEMDVVPCRGEHLGQHVGAVHTRVVAAVSMSAVAGDQFIAAAADGEQQWCDGKPRCARPKEPIVGGAHVAPRNSRSKCGNSFQQASKPARSSDWLPKNTPSNVSSVRSSGERSGATRDASRKYWRFVLPFAN